MTVADSFKRFRKNFNLTQKQVAAAINVKEQSYQRYEYGTNIPTATVLINIADAFNVSTDYLLGRTDIPEVYRQYKPNAETIAAMEEAEKISNGTIPAKTFSTVDELMEDLNAED